MDRLIAEKEVETKTEKKTEINVEEKAEPSSQYINSFENLTVADIKRQEEKRQAEEFKVEKEELIKEQFKPQEEVKAEQASQKIIEKPNYDLIEENKKIVKLHSKKKEKKKVSKKTAGIVMSCALAAGAIICVTNAVLIDNMNANYIQIDETYNMNLASYLRQIYNLDSAQNSMELVETYPEEMLDAGDFGEQSNWFDRLCNFINGLFGG